MRRVASSAVLVLAAAAAACAEPARPKAEPTAVVLPPAEGAAVPEGSIRTAAGAAELILREMRLDRAEVLPTADGRIRIVLPESQASRIPELRRRLEESNLGVRVE